MNSGIRSIGDATQAAANPSNTFDPRGTRGSRTRSLKSRARFGTSVASSRAAERRPATNSATSSAAYTAAATSTEMTRALKVPGPAYGAYHAAAMAEAEDVRLHEGVRVLLWAVVLLAMLAGFVLFVFSDRTDHLFAWTIEPPITAAFLGAAYLSASVMAFLSVRTDRWREARAMAVGIATVTPLLLAVTLIHLSKFRLSSFAGVAWMVVYVSLTVLAPVLIATQVRGLPNERGPRRPAETALGLVLAAGLCTVGAVLMLSPSSASSFWPWRLTTLSAQAIGSWFVAHGLTAGWLVWRGQLLRVRAAAVGYATFGALGLVALLRYRSTLSLGSPRTAVAYAALALATVGGAAAALTANRLRQPDRPLARP